MRTISCPKIKTINSDFQVSEIPLLGNLFPDNKKFSRYKLKKSSYTTFQSLQYISRYFNIDVTDIGFAGLKDEDGISEQFISIHHDLPLAHLEMFNKKYFQNKEKFIELIKHDYQSEKIKIGQLLGNQFKIIIRAIDERMLEIFTNNKKLSFLFINYYGTQRFGLANSEKNTHHIGRYIIEQDYLKAINILSRYPDELGCQARESHINTVNKAKQFFDQINKNIVAFYQSSYYSYQWNQKIKKIILNNKLKYYNHNDAGIEYYFLEPDGFKQLPTFLPYIRVVNNDGRYQEQSLNRNTYIQLNIVVNRVFKDTLHEEHWACEINFFLPSGTYATMAFSQFVDRLKVTKEIACHAVA